MKFKAILNIKSIIRFEQLTGKPFTGIDYTSEDDAHNLLYAVVLSNNDIMMSMDEFRLVIQNNKILGEITYELKKHGDVVQQFVKEGKADKQVSENDIHDSFVKDIVSVLILSGVDANFIYNLWICDLPMLIDAYERIKREKMESERLWTYFTILPHVDNKKLKSAQEMYPFPWEMEEIERTKKKSLDNTLEKFNKFINGEVKFN